MTGSDDLSVEGTNIRYNKFSRWMGGLHRHREETKKDDYGTE
jgi:putative IMPACT (imprinted ancient) family translation regulator